MKHVDPEGTAEFTGAVDRPAVCSSGERIAGRYELHEKLGAGGMATVHRARDHKNDLDVAIKFMKTDLGGTARRRFFREFNTIAGIRHPCCLRVYEIGETDEAPYFTMELHPGRSVTSILGESPESVAPMLVDLTLAVDYIHSQGIVHRDVKPSNVMVQRSGDRDDSRLSCKLADFGLSKFYQLDSSLTAERGLVGTPAYCAPEQIDGVDIDHRVDLYAIGVLAFELLSGGRHPFSEARAQGMNALLSAQLRTEPPKLSNANPEIPESVSEVVGSYLAKEPDARASSALPLRQVLCQEYGIEVDDRLEQLSSPSDVKLNAVGFVCRDLELGQVDQFLKSNLVSRQPGSAAGSQESKPLLLFTGEPGTGKTIIMQEAVRRAFGMGCQVFEGRCFDGCTSAFQPVIEIVRQMLTRLSRTNRGANESTLLAEISQAAGDVRKTQAILSDYQSELLLIAPELRRWMPANAQPPAFRNDSEYMYRALAAMFVELGQVSSLCLCFDDIQWADNSTLRFLQHLCGALRQNQQSGDSGSDTPRLAVLCTGRSGYPALQSFRSSVEAQSFLTEIEMHALRPEETKELLALRLGCLASSVDVGLSQSIDKLCQGNPFFVSETIREWHSRGMVVRTTDGWQRVHQSLEDDSSLPSTVRSALRMRINDLSESAQVLLPVAGAIGRVVELDLLSAVVPDLVDSDLLDAVDELLHKRVLTETNSAGRVAFAHDLLRETVQADLSASRRRSLHRRIAQVLEDGDASKKAVSPALLAHHYLAGEMTEPAFQHLLEAAKIANRVYAFDDALNYLEQAAENIPAGVSRADQYRLYSLTAEAAGHTSQLPRAEKAAETALDYAESRLQRGRMYGELGTLACFQGRQREGQKKFDQALDALGMRRARAWPSRLLSIQLSLTCFHIIPAPLLAIFNRPKKYAEEQQLACEILYAFAHSVASQNILNYTQVCAYNVRLAKTLDSDVAKAVAYAKYGLNLGFSGANARISLPFTKLSSLAIRYGKMGLSFVQTGDRPEVVASVQTSLGFCYYCAGQLSEAESTLLDAEETLRRCRDLHTSYAYHYLRHVYSMIGEPAKVIDAGLKELELAASSNDTELMAWAHYGLTHGYALAGQINDALKSARESIRFTLANDSSFRAVSLMEEGFALMQDSRYEEAAESLHEAHLWMKKRFFFFEIAMPVFPRMVEARLGPNWFQGKGADGCDPRPAKKYARNAWFFAQSFPNIRPHTWRVLGRLSAAQGRMKKARTYFERAIAEAEKLGAKYERARALYDSAIAFPDLAERKQRALNELQELQAVMPDAEMHP